MNALLFALREAAAGVADMLAKFPPERRPVATTTASEGKDGTITVRIEITLAEVDVRAEMQRRGLGS